MRDGQNHFVCPPAECVCFSNNKKQPRLPPALISMNQLRIRARHPSTPQQSHPSPPTVPLIQHRAKDAYQLSAGPGALLKPCCALVLPSCNSISIFKFLSPQNDIFLQGVPHEQAHCASLSLIWQVHLQKLKRRHALMRLESGKICGGAYVTSRWSYLHMLFMHISKNGSDLMIILIKLVLSVQYFSCLRLLNHNYVSLLWLFVNGL